MSGKEGDLIGWQVNGEHIQRSRLRVDSRKWIASQLKPKKYGDKLDLTSGGKELRPMVVNSTVAARFADAPSEPAEDCQE